MCPNFCGRPSVHRACPQPLTWVLTIVSSCPSWTRPSHLKYTNKPLNQWKTSLDWYSERLPVCKSPEWLTVPYNQAVLAWAGWKPHTDWYTPIKRGGVSCSAVKPLSSFSREVICNTGVGDVSQGSGCVCVWRGGWSGWYKTKAGEERLKLCWDQVCMRSTDTEGEKRENICCTWGAAEIKPCCGLWCWPASCAWEDM